MHSQCALTSLLFDVLCIERQLLMYSYLPMLVHYSNYFRILNYATTHKFEQIGWYTLASGKTAQLNKLVYLAISRATTGPVRRMVKCCNEIRSGLYGPNFARPLM